MLVSGWQQALTLVAVLIPGFVFQGVQRNRIGPSPEDRDIGPRLIRALAFSVGFLAIYLVCLGGRFTDRLTRPDHRFDDPRSIGLTALILVFIVPAAAGHLAASFITRRRFNQTGFWSTFFRRAQPVRGELTWRKALLSNETDYSPIPTAWDYATERIEVGSFIRVLNSDGAWLGGRVSGAAFFTGYPEPRDIFIDETWSITDDGTFDEPLPGPTGAWIPCSDAALVQITPPVDLSTDSPPEPAEIDA